MSRRSITLAQVNSPLRESPTPIPEKKNLKITFDSQQREKGRDFIHYLP